jgi:hypothetical protein
MQHAGPVASFRYQSSNMKKSGRVLYFVASGVALATFLVYLATLRNDFVLWDDDQYIILNPHIQSLDLAFLKWAFFDYYASNWHPLTWISHALDYSLWGYSAFGHHLTNNILHALNTLLVVLLAAKLVATRNGRAADILPAAGKYDRTALITAGTAGLLFGLHPIHVESVAWVSERKDLLCALFYLLSVITYAEYVTSTEKDPVQNISPLQRLTKWYFLSLVLFVMALLSKPMAVSLPFVLLILDWYPLQRFGTLKTFKRVFIEKIPFFALSAASSWITVLAQRKAIAMVQEIPLPARLLVAAKSLVLYVEKMALPLDLSPYYPYPQQISLSFPIYLSSIVLVTGTTLFCFYLAIAGKKRVWLSVWSYYLATLAPVIGVVQVGGQAMADRYTYLPSLGPFILIGLASAWLWEHMNAWKKWGRLIKVSCAVAALCITVSLTYMTIRQIHIWKNSFELWSCVIEKEPGKVQTAYQNRGAYLSNIGKLDEAIADFNTAIALSPRDSTSYYLRGLNFYRMGTFDKAIADFEKTIALDPLYWEAYYYRDQSLGKSGTKADRTEQPR